MSETLDSGAFSPEGKRRQTELLELYRNLDPLSQDEIDAARQKCHEAAKREPTSGLVDLEDLIYKDKTPEEAAMTAREIDLHRRVYVQLNQEGLYPHL